MNKTRIFVGFILLILTTIVGYMWYGFLFPDPNALLLMSNRALIIHLWLPRIVLPLFILVSFYVFLKWNFKLFVNFVTLIVTIFILLLVLYPVLDFRYHLDNSPESYKQKIHSFLQLKPRPLDEQKLVNSQDDIKIFCLGGSTTEFPNSAGDGWPKLLENKFRSNGFDSLHVFNMGREYYTTLHTLINYETNLRHRLPNILIIMHNVNDLLDNADFSYLSNGEFREDYGNFFGPMARLIKESGFFGLHLYYFNKLWYHKPRTEVNVFDFPGLVSFERNLNTLIDLAQLDKVKVILMTQPNIVSENMSNEIKEACLILERGTVGDDKKWSYSTANSGFKQYNDKIREIAKFRGVYLIDLETQLPKSLDYFTDEVHYTDKSFSIITDYIYTNLISQNILK